MRPSEKPLQKTLPIEATIVCRGHESCDPEPVYLQLTSCDTMGTKWVLKIGNTPGQWYVSTLLEDMDRKWIAIDSGQGWSCTNINAIIQSVLAHI